MCVAACAPVFVPVFALVFVAVVVLVFMSGFARVDGVTQVLKNATLNGNRDRTY